MNIKDFKAGTMAHGYQYDYFLPETINHPFTWMDEDIHELLERASLRIGELNACSRLVPDTDMFIKMHILKEAVVSSRIEGTRTNMEEALIDVRDIDPERRDDWEEVNNYVLAMNSAIEELKTLPLSNRLLQKTHGVLLASGRGVNKTPGEFRRSQNWIGGASLSDAIFIPPSHEALPELLSDLERFLNNGKLHIPGLVRIAIAHYQFETIHPFLDGNGRLGRLLITLYLVSSGILDTPLLYLSDYFERNKTLYYDNLTRVREKNDLAQWIKFVLVGMAETAEASATTLKTIIDLKATIERKSIMLMGKRSRQGLEFFHMLFKMPVVTIKEVQNMTGLSPKAAGDLVLTFVEYGILSETTGFQRNRVFIFQRYLGLFEDQRR